MKKKIILFFIVLAILGCEEAEDVGEQPELYQNGEVLTLFENDPKGINVIFLGDGFIEKDLTKGGSYEKSGRSIIEHLFTVPPFSTHQEYFNAYIVFAESKDEFIRQKSFPRQTAFGIEISLATDRLTIQDPDACFRYAHKAVNYDSQRDIIIVLANDYREMGIAAYGIAVTCRRMKEKMAVHEVGHTFANLADEYISPSRAEYYIGSRNLDELVSRSPNVDLKPDLEQIKWSHFIGENGYETVGAHEGGLYLSEGVWRPEETSIMLSHTESYFNAPSREAIVKKIFKVKGIPYSFEEFKRIDVIPTTTNARLSRLDSTKELQCW
ncbi:M64 family metallopeptidase [Catalinimonas sp. 4WD22]|uniref:M64 family metallopeptidase n=1 Tax=Catalinimonas locisalis TaxID=3133978 RepID=UPI003101AA84